SPAPDRQPTAAGASRPPVGKTIVIGMTQYPDTLFGIESQSSATPQVLAAVQPPCITYLSYEYQPVCFASVPSFENGGVVARNVTVDSSYRGNAVINGELVTDTASLTQPVELEQLVVTWTLIDGLAWEDGVPVTARDFTFAAALYAHPDVQNASRYLLERTETYEAPDAKTLVWTGLPGYRDDSAFLNFQGPEPEHVLSEMEPGKIGVRGYANKPLAYGPYKVVDNVPQESTTLVANERYWRAGEGLPKVENIVFKYLTSERQAIQLLRDGEIDVLGSVDMTADSIPELEILEEDGVARVQYVPSPAWEHLDFMVDPGEGGVTRFGDARVRRAVAYAIDRQQIIGTVLRGKTVVLNSFVPRGHWAYPPSGAGLETYEFDPDKAKALLAEAGWSPGADGILAKDGDRFMVSLDTASRDQARQAAALLIQADLKAVGIDVTLNSLPGAEMLFKREWDGALAGRHFDLALYPWLSDGEPPTALYRCDQIPSPEDSYAGQNHTGWCDADYDALALAAEAEPDRAKRLLLLIEAQKIWNAELPSLPLYQRLIIGAHRVEVTGLRLDPTSAADSWNIETWDVSR
ncbi:MAG TPA: peptide ABC transporter substrate-binding protein, partial [Herpetosiphonaceae bacterium]